jgi:hypothetical protein
MASRADVASALGEHLACEHLDQPRGPRRRGDLPRENLLRGYSSTVILGIRVISCANDRPFKRDTGKQALAPAVGVDCGYWRDCSRRSPTYGPGGHTDVPSQRDVYVAREGLYSGIRVEDHHEFRHFGTNLEAEAYPTSANG